MAHIFCEIDNKIKHKETLVALRLFIYGKLVSLFSRY